jgi:hypothetical protein
MELAEAIKRLIPLQVVLPDRRHPLTTVAQYAAEVFLADTTAGPAVIWLEPFWCERPESCHIAYAQPRAREGGSRWVDPEPRFGPGCLAYQKPVILERVDQTSGNWEVHQAWLRWREGKEEHCGRKAAWTQVERCFGERILARRAEG